MIAAQVGGRILDRRGARPAVVFGGALGAVGFFLLAGKLTDLSLGAQWLDIAIAGGGLGLMLGPASTDAVNRAPSTSYSEVTGITQTARNFGASLGLAVLGAILITRNDTNVTAALTKHGVPSGVAHRVAASFGASGPGAGAGRGTAARARARRSARVRALDADRLLHHGRRDGRDVHRGGSLAPARPRGARRRRRAARLPETALPMTDGGLVTKVSPSVGGRDRGASGRPGRRASGLTLFAVIDHSGEAHARGLELRDTKVVIFGNPEAGTPVMQAAPLAALDLPLKVLVWADGGRPS